MRGKILETVLQNDNGNYLHISDSIICYIACGRVEPSIRCITIKRCDRHSTLSKFHVIILILDILISLFQNDTFPTTK